MARGRKRTPTNVLKLRDSAALRMRHRRNVEPEPPIGVPECPEWLDEEAAECWSYTTQGLTSMGIMAKTDAAILATYCNNWSLWVRTSKMLQVVEDWTDKDSLAIFRTNQVACRELCRAAEQFGLTPAARARLDVAKEQYKSDEFDKFLDEKKAQA